MADNITTAPDTTVITDPNNGLVLVAVRYIVAAVGAFFVRKGYATNDDVLTLTAAAISVTPMVLAMIAKRRANKHTVTVASLPNSAITFK